MKDKARSTVEVSAANQLRGLAGNKRSRERMFLGANTLENESSRANSLRGANVPRSESSKEQKFQGANWPGCYWNFCARERIGPREKRLSTQFLVLETTSAMSLHFSLTAL